MLWRISREIFSDDWKPDGTRRQSIEKLDEVVVLSQNQCTFEDLELVLGPWVVRMMLVTMKWVTPVMKRKKRLHTGTKWYLANGLVWVYAESMSFLLRTPENH